MAYKGQSPGKSAQHDEAPGSESRVNAAVDVVPPRRDSRPYPGRSARHGRKVHDKEDGHLRGHQPQRPVAFVQDPGYSDRYDQPMAQGAGSFVCQRTVGEYPLPDYGLVDSVSRPVRTRMRGGVGRGSSKLPFTRLDGLMVIRDPIPVDSFCFFR
jgi:hypothetical protein